jgi:RNA polymerase sigma factor (sigma-70 family)
MLEGGMASTVIPEERFRQLYELHAGAILSYFMRRTDSEMAQDCTAETFLVAWRRIDDVPDQALPWLYGVARRVLQNLRRSGGRMARLVERLRVQRPRPEPSPELVVIRHFEDAELADALRKLRPADRELLLLANWEELPHSDIGEMLGCSAHAVDQRIYRAVHRLARELADAGQKQGGVTTPAAQPEGETP